MDPRRIAEALAEIGRLQEATGEPGFKSAAHERAAGTIRHLGADDLARRVGTGKLEELPNIGKALAWKIRTLFETGRLDELDRLRGQVPRGFRELTRVAGLGPKRILALHAALGIEDLDDLERAARDGRIRQQKGFSAAGEAKLLAAIPAARDWHETFLWPDALAAAADLEPALRDAGVLRVEVTGDARRAREEVASAEVLAVVPDPDAAVARLAAATGLRAVSERRLAGADPDGLPLCVHVAGPDEAAAVLALTTGPASHAATLAERAEARGLRLGVRGLRDRDDAAVRLADEAELYALLGEPWTPPELRDEPGHDPDEVPGLLQHADLVGAVHCHTTWSDGRASLEELARAADELGFEYLTVTDHSPAAFYAGGVAVDDLRRQWDELARVQEQVDVVLLRGTECDILADGALDYPDAILEQLDVVIASVHQRHALDRDASTARLIRAMSHPVRKIWGHALGRLVGRRPPIDCDVPRILDAIAAAGGLVEVNGDPNRLDLPPEWLREARKRGIGLVISVDAHSVRGLRVGPFGVGIARRAGAQATEVANTRPVAEFRRLVHPAG